MGIQRPIKAPAPAKLNLYLDVLGRRDDGYHEIETVMQTIDLYDELLFAEGHEGEGLRLKCDAEGMPAAEDNLVFKAAQLLHDRFGGGGNAAIEIRKHIPPGTGLGGGSSDAAETLAALCALWKLDAGTEQLEVLAAELGSDVPFFVRGGASLCRGRGEVIRPLICSATLHFVVVIPPLHISTAAAYKAADSLTKESIHVNIERVVIALERGDPEMLGDGLHNALRRAAVAVDPRVADIERTLDALFAGTDACGYSLSGSGSAWFGVYRNRAEAVEAAAHVGEHAGFFARAVRSLPPRAPCGG